MESTIRSGVLTTGEPPFSFSTKLPEVLRSRRLSISWLSKKTGLDYDRLKRLCNGEFDPGVDEAVKIADAFKVYTFDLLDTSE